MIKETYNPHTGPQVGDYVKIDDFTLPRDFTCRVARVVGKEGEDSYLVEFIESHPKLHDGNYARDKALKGKAHHCWWVGKGNMAPLKVDAMIMNDGDTIYCQRSDKRRITGTATCSKLDEYDPLTGAIIALARAHGQDPTAAAYRVLKAFSKIPTEAEATPTPTPKKLRLVFGSTGSPFGEVGTPTPYKDKYGAPLFVGDQVEIKSVAGYEPRDLYTVVETPEDGPFVMGICSDCGPKTGTLKNWVLTWAKSWKELKPGDKIHSGYIDVVEAPEAPTIPAQKLEILKGRAHYGIVGTPTKMKDCRGAQLFVGDRVNIRSSYPPHEVEYLRLVVESGQKQFVMGIKGCCNADTGKIDDNWRIEKVKGFQTLTTDYVDPDSDFDFKVVEAPEAPAPKPKKKVKVIRAGGEESMFYGELGADTDLVDSFGTPLHVGDVVSVLHRNRGFISDDPVVMPHTGGPFVMGLAGQRFTKDRKNSDWQIVKARPYTDLLIGEKFSDGWLEVKEEEIDE